MGENEKKQESIYITEEDLAVAYNEPASATHYRQTPAYAPVTGAAQPAGEMRLCPGCQRLITGELVFCQHCGFGPMKAIASTEIKKKGTAALLAIIPALFGFFGIAHFYLEKLGTGFLFLFAGWALLGASIFCLVTGDWVWAIVLGVIWVGLLIWQVFDAVALAEENYSLWE
jgi:TM2 domain-containing membrane protein YozV